MGYCRLCNAPVSENQSFCYYCGTSSGVWRPFGGDPATEGMKFWNLTGGCVLVVGISILAFAIGMLVNGEILGAIVATLIGVWFTYGGYKSLTRKKWPQYEISDMFNTAQAHHEQGRSYAQQGRLNEAIQEFEIAVGTFPNAAGGHYDLGVAYANAGRVNEAIQQYQSALRLNPNLDEAHNNLGALYYETRQFDKALRELQAAIRINPNT